MSLEFLLIMGFSTFMLVVFLIIGVHQLNEASTQRDLSEVLDIANSVQQELLTAASVSDGYRRVFTLPQEIGNQPYTIGLANGTDYSVITFETAKRRYSVRTPQCNGTILRGANAITKTNGSLRCN